MSRAYKLRSAEPELVVDLWLYPAERGGHPIQPGWGSLCTVQSEQGDGWVGYDGWPLLGDNPMAPGERRRVGYVFLSGQEAIEYLKSAETFYLWEMGLIGEATIVCNAALSGG